MYRRSLRLVWLWASVLLILFLGTAHGAGEMAPIAAGTELPKLTFPGFESREVQSYLGLTGSGSFTLSEVSGRIVFMEILSVF